MNEIRLNFRPCLIVYLTFVISGLDHDGVKGDYYAVNWTEASVVGMGTETHYQDPSVTPLAPCPCDLIYGLCDAQCCCDKDCSEKDKELFTCVEGLEGGHDTHQDCDYSCAYQGPYSPEWHSFLCYIANNNPYLGLYFKNENIIQEFQKYITRVHPSKYSFAASYLQAEDSLFNLHYKMQASVETIFHSNDGIFRSPLFLPQPVLNGICADFIPVNFLKSFKHQCSTVLTPVECETEPSLSTEFYLQEAPENTSESFISVIGDLNTLELVNASVKYLCLKNSLKFIKTNRLSRTATEFLRRRWDTIEEYFDECQGKNKPLYNETTHVCENVVLSVDYNFGWKGSKIIEVDVEIILGDIPISIESISQNYFQELGNDALIHKSPDDNESKVGHRQTYIGLLQNFESNFHYVVPLNFSYETSINHTSSNNDSFVDEVDSLYEFENITEMESVSERSGNPGYEFGKPVLAGYNVYNGTDTENDTVDPFFFTDINDATGIFIWQPDATSVCSFASTREVIFGVDMFSSCFYSYSDNYSCEDVREEVLLLMMQLIQADVVSKMGSPNITSEEDFCPIIMDKNNPGNESDRCYAPTAVQYEIVYRDISDPGSLFPINQIIGICIRFHYSEIVITSEADRSSILLSSSVKYFESPKPSQLSRFWEAMEDQWCAGGTCWRELLYPWTHDARAMYEVYNNQIIDLMRNSALIVLLSLPVLYFILHKNLELRI